LSDSTGAMLLSSGSAHRLSVEIWTLSSASRVTIGVGRVQVARHLDRLTKFVWSATPAEPVSRSMPAVRRSAARGRESRSAAVLDPAAVHQRAAIAVNQGGVPIPVVPALVAAGAGRRR
jgi:hypothetical protein